MMNDGLNFRLRILNSIAPPQCYEAVIDSVTNIGEYEEV